MAEVTSQATGRIPATIYETTYDGLSTSPGSPEYDCIPSQSSNAKARLSGDVHYHELPSQHAEDIKPTDEELKEYENCGKLMYPSYPDDEVVGYAPYNSYGGSAMYLQGIGALPTYAYDDARQGVFSGYGGIHYSNSPILSNYPSNPPTPPTESYTPFAENYDIAPNSGHILRTSSFQPSRETSGYCYSIHDGEYAPAAYAGNKYEEQHHYSHRVQADARREALNSRMFHMPVMDHANTTQIHLASPFPPGSPFESERPSTASTVASFGAFSPDAVSPAEVYYKPPPPYDPRVFNPIIELPVEAPHHRKRSRSDAFPEEIVSLPAKRAAIKPHLQGAGVPHETLLCGWKMSHGRCRAAIPANSRSVKEHIQTMHAPSDPPENKALLEKVLVRCQWENCPRPNEAMQYSNLPRHVCSTHPDVSVAVKANMVCKKCSKKFPRVDAYRRHDGTCCICKSCQMEFISLKAFEEHKNHCPNKTFRAKRGRRTNA